LGLKKFLGCFTLQAKGEKMPDYSKSFDLPGYSHGKLTDAAKAKSSDLSGAAPPSSGKGNPKKNSKKSKKKSKSTGY
jgi:hypothetical protein